MNALRILSLILFLAAPLCVHAAAPVDWLLDPSSFKAKVIRSVDGREVVLDNGLVRRVIRLVPSAATVAFENLMTGEPIIRAVRPEACVVLDGVRYEIGGLSGQPVQSFLKPAWIETLKANPDAFQFAVLKTGQTEVRFPWKKRLEWMPKDAPWPPPGVSLTLEFRPPAGSGGSRQPREGLVVEVHYELYDGLPLISKWIVVRNGTPQAVRLTSFVSEILAAVEYESYVDDNPRWELPSLYVETDYAFGGMGSKGGNRGVHWGPDPEYLSQVNYNRNTPCLLECRPPLGPDQEIAPGGSFESFRAFELAHDSTDRERKGLAQRRMYRTIAPWVTENPVLMHVRSARPDAVKLAIDQCAEVGFEMVILTFGSGFDFESRDQKYQAQIKELADYGKAKGIVLGGYSLCSSRPAGTPADNTVGTNAFGVAPCLGAKWGREYLDQLRSFMENTGLAVLEHDGSYPGDTCAATNHPFHRGLEDSQWVQWKAITGLYQWCCGNGVYLNIPDWYFLSGGTKTGMGYREVNWSLPRAYQEIIERQNIFDGTWEKTPSMGWMFVPLTEYQGGGAAATIEPLKDHLPHYEQRLANLFGAGVMACYRGPRLYDTDETKAVVKRWVDFYKKHREVLNADLLHLRRADGRDLDYLLHVNPAGKEKGLLMVYNPLEQEVTRTLRVPLYYTGKTATAAVSERDGKARTFKLDREYYIDLPVSVPARGVTWFVVE
ncbi:MAG: hypothetical protein ACLQU3_21105 [Limisphaerales bacterium]